MIFIQEERKVAMIWFPVLLHSAIFIFKIPFKVTDPKPSMENNEFEEGEILDSDEDASLQAYKVFLSIDYMCQNRISRWFTSSPNFKLKVRMIDALTVMSHDSCFILSVTMSSKYVQLNIMWGRCNLHENAVDYFLK